MIDFFGRWFWAALLFAFTVKTPLLFVAGVVIGVVMCSAF